MAQTLSAEELLAGAALTHTVPVPEALVRPGSNASGALGEVVLRPLTVRDIERVLKAANDERTLTSILLVHQALVAPKLSVDQIANLPAGLLEYLLEKTNALSGLGMGESDLEKAVKAPLARACFVLAKEFGWTPAECAELTVGQVLLYLEMLARDRGEPMAAAALTREPPPGKTGS
jgi:hypothetical protein